MVFIRAQNIKRDSSGRITGGTASAVRSVRESTGSGSSKSRQKVVERLGKVLFLSENGRSGIFRSPSRGLVSYDADTGEFGHVSEDDQRIAGSARPSVPCNSAGNAVHKVFGDACLLLEFLKKCGMLPVLRETFSDDKDYERMLCHLLCSILRDGGNIKCDDFTAKSFASSVFPDLDPGTLRHDYGFYSLLGETQVKVGFFEAFAGMMRKKDKGFGRACYADTVSLRGASDRNSPIRNIVCHSTDEMLKDISRIALILDEKSGLPLLFYCIPQGDPSPDDIYRIIDDACWGLQLDGWTLVLDGAYASEELFSRYHRGSRTKIICPMPDFSGYPYMEVYRKLSKKIRLERGDFVCHGALWCGHRCDIEIFGRKQYAYVFVDRTKALTGFTEYFSQHEEEFRKLSDEEAGWIEVKSGYSVMISNIRTTPEDLLNRYFSRADLDRELKSGRDYLREMPDHKLDDLTIRGKILSDIIDADVRHFLNEKLKGTGISLSDAIGRTQSLICCADSTGTVTVDAPSEQVRKIYEIFGIGVPQQLDIKKFTEGVMHPGRQSRKRTG